MDTTTTTEAIALRTSGKVVVVDFLKGELKDEREILKLLEKLGAMIEKRQHVQLLLNMEKVTYISSAGIGALVSLLKKTARQNGTLKFCRVSDEVKEIFEIMHLTKIFTMLATEVAAVASF
jgi:anti-sigma B factor antagonist